MTILHLIKSLGRGGAEMLLPETLRVHDREKFDFHYGYFLPHKNQLVERLSELRAPVHCFSANGAAGMLGRVPDIIQYVRNHNVDLIHAHLPLAGVVARIVGKRTGVPVVYTEHNLQETYHPLTRMANMATFGWQDTVIAVSEGVESSIRTHWTKKHPDLVTVANGVNTERFVPGDRKLVRRELNLPTEGPYVGTVCVFRPQKELLRWVALAAEVAQEIPTARFVLVGDGPDENKLREAVAAAGLTNRFHFPGRLDDVRPWLRTLDVYLMTSAYEGLPVAMLEAMSSGLPVLSTAVGGIPEVVRSGREGFLCPEKDTTVLLPELLRLAQNPEMARETGFAARKRVIDSYSIIRMSRTLEELYKKISNRGN